MFEFLTDVLEVTVGVLLADAIAKHIPQTMNTASQLKQAYDKKRAPAA